MGDPRSTWLQIGNATALRNGLKHPSYCHSAQSTFIPQRTKAFIQEITGKKEAQNGSSIKWKHTQPALGKAFHRKDSLLQKSSVEEGYLRLFWASDSVKNKNFFFFLTIYNL